jgi:hypothetical protein
MNVHPGRNISSSLFAKYCTNSSKATFSYIKPRFDKNIVYSDFVSMYTDVDHHCFASIGRLTHNQLKLFAKYCTNPSRC